MKIARRCRHTQDMFEQLITEPWSEGAVKAAPPQVETAAIEPLTALRELLRRIDSKEVEPVALHLTTSAASGGQLSFVFSGIVAYKQ